MSKNQKIGILLVVTTVLMLVCQWLNRKMDSQSTRHIGRGVL